MSKTTITICSALAVFAGLACPVFADCRDIWIDQAREDYLDLHGGRWAPVPIGALGAYLRRLGNIADTIERIGNQADDAMLRTIPVSLRLHAGILRSCTASTVASSSDIR